MEGSDAMKTLPPELLVGETADIGRRAGRNRLGRGRAEAT